MENVFRTKKFRETTSRVKTQDVVSGTLDSIHQHVVSSLLDQDKDCLNDRRTLILEEIENFEKSVVLEDVLKVSKLKDELKKIDDVLEENTPLESYYLKNADIMLK